MFFGRYYNSLFDLQDGKEIRKKKEKKIKKKEKIRSIIPIFLPFLYFFLSLQFSFSVILAKV